MRRGVTIARRVRPRFLLGTGGADIEAGRGAQPWPRREPGPPGMGRTVNDRQLLVLISIPSAPRWVTTEDIVLRLHEAGHAAHKRSVQRDLLALSRLLPLRKCRPGKPYAWQWSGPCPCCGRAE
jgi:hypothetical protein